VGSFPKTGPVSYFHMTLLVPAPPPPPHEQCHRTQLPKSKNYATTTSFCMQHDYTVYCWNDLHPCYIIDISLPVSFAHLIVYRVFFLTTELFPPRSTPGVASSWRRQSEFQPTLAAQPTNELTPCLFCLCLSLFHLLLAVVLDGWSRGPFSVHL
jgi:hypothetical protein